MSRSDTTIDWRATLTEALNAPGSLGTTYTRFYNYSFLNQIRLMMQGVAEPVATYNRWIELGRQVRKGSKAKVVLAPVLVGGDLKDGNGNIVIGSDGEPRKRQILVGFRDSRTVFGYSETDGDELPAVELPGWDTDTALGVLGIGRVAFDMVNGNVQGFSFEDDNGRHLALNPTAVYPAKTLLHELAHLVLGHCKNGDHTHRGVAEFEAEATAYLVAKELELIEWDAAESRAYIQTWLGDSDVTEDNISRVFAAVNKILTAIDPRIWKNMRPTGVEVSIPWSSTTGSTPRACSVFDSSIRCSSERPSRSSLVTTSWSPARFADSSALPNSGRRASLPEALSTKICSQPAAASEWLILLSVLPSSLSPRCSCPSFRRPCLLRRVPDADGSVARVKQADVLGARISDADVSGARVEQAEVPGARVQAEDPNSAAARNPNADVRIA